MFSDPSPQYSNAKKKKKEKRKAKIIQSVKTKGSGGQKIRVLIQFTHFNSTRTSSMTLSNLLSLSKPQFSPLVKEK